MCGIYGAMTFGGQAPCTATLARMAGVTVHRGPDDAGEFVQGPLRMGMRRLSIIDLAGGHQPISNEDGTVWVVCNGEIYNFRELRQLLIGRGHTFTTASDTEVIVHLYEEYGEDFISRLDGMFGLALWDRNRQELFLARDRLGIKPLYVQCNGRELWFASELKAILAGQDRSPSLDTAALSQYLSLGYVPAPLSIFAGTEKLPPGVLLRVCATSGEQTSTRYWRPGEVSVSPSASDWPAAVRTQLETSIAAQMVSDVPLGAFLSGGIDSSAVVAIMARHSTQPVKTYAIGFEETGAGALFNELSYARRVAELFGTDHHEIVVQPDVASLLPKLLWHLDEPVADSAFITTHLVSELAGQDVKVILSGVGGDELFGGYRRYLGPYYDRWMRFVPDQLLRRVLIPLASRLPSDRHSALLNASRLAKSYILSQALEEKDRYRQYVSVFEQDMQSELMLDPPVTHPDALQEAFNSLTTSDPLDRLMQVDLLTQMPDDLLALTDRMTMASSIECRVPLLDQSLVDLSFSMPSDNKIKGRELKHILKTSLAGDLPKDVLYRAKRGFGAPMGAWLKESLAGMVGSLLSRETVERRGLFRYEAIETLISDHAANREDHTDHLQALTNLEIFSRVYLDGRAPDDVSDELKSMAGS